MFLSCLCVGFNGLGSFTFPDDGKEKDKGDVFVLTTLDNFMCVIYIGSELLSGFQTRIDRVFNLFLNLCEWNSEWICLVVGSPFLTL